MRYFGQTQRGKFTPNVWLRKEEQIISPLYVLSSLSSDMDLIVQVMGYCYNILKLSGFLSNEGEENCFTNQEFKILKIPFQHQNSLIIFIMFVA